MKKTKDINSRLNDIEFRGIAIEKNGKIKPGYWMSGGIKKDNENVYIITEHYGAVKVIPKTLTEYTGFKDIYGTKIYEGDIIDYSYDIYNGNYDTLNLKGVVNFEEGCFCVKPFELNSKKLKKTI